MKKKWLCLSMAILLACSALFGCGGSSDSTETSSAAEMVSSDDGTTLRLTQSSGGSIDPGVGTDCASGIAYANMYDSLVYPDMDNMAQPLLADTWETSEDGLTWTFHLKDGVKFHDGTDLEASDVVYSMRRLQTLGEGFAYLFTNYVDSCEAPDKQTVVFHMKQSFAPFLSILPRLYVLNEDLVKANYQSGTYGDDGDFGKAFLAENDAGSGAYSLSEMRTGDRYIMKKNKDYFQGWEGKDKSPDTVEVIMNTEAATVRTMMKNGDIQISDQWQTNEAYDALAQIDGVKVGSFVNGQMLYVMLNTKKAPTDDVHVRKALAYLIDYDQVCNSLFPGYVKATSQVPDTLRGYVTDGWDYHYDLDKAKEELAQSSYAADLKSGAMQLEIEWIADVPDEEKLALLIQSLGSQIGLSVKVTKVPWATHVDNCGSVETTPNASVCFEAPEYAEAGAMLYQRYSSAMAGTWQETEWLQDPELDKAIEDALTTMDDDERMKKYAAIEKEAAENVWGIAVAEQSEKHAYKNNITIPAIERGAAGQSTAMALGYNYLFRDYEMN